MSDVWNSSGVLVYYNELIVKWRSRHDYFYIPEHTKKQIISSCFHWAKYLIYNYLLRCSQIQIKTQRDTKRHSDVWKKSGILKQTDSCLRNKKSALDRGFLDPQCINVARLSVSFTKNSIAFLNNKNQTSRTLRGKLWQK